MKKKDTHISRVEVTSRDGKRHSAEIRYSIHEDPVLVATAFASKYDVSRKDYEALLEFLRKIMKFNDENANDKSDRSLLE